MRVISLATTGAVCWEVYAWLSDYFLRTRVQPSLNDTVQDLVLGMSGAAVYAWMMLHVRPSGEQLQAADGAGESLRPGDWIACHGKSLPAFRRALPGFQDKKSPAYAGLL